MQDKIEIGQEGCRKGKLERIEGTKGRRDEEKDKRDAG